MSARRALAAAWDFVVGDDPRLALAAVAAIGLTALVGAWWLAPLVALVALYWSLRPARSGPLRPARPDRGVPPAVEPAQRQQQGGGDDQRPGGE
jgi:hypothetical protein